MIDEDTITRWAKVAPWAQRSMVEQDLIISRALVALFSDETIRAQLAFRGGTSLAKLHFERPPRYSEDIDLVQVEPGAIGPLMDAIHGALDPWLGQPKWKQTHGRVTLNYRFTPTDAPGSRKLKIEINTREHGSVHPIEHKEHTVETNWFSGVTLVPTYALDELLGTKLRALYQRKKGRDLFDLDFALRSGKANATRIVGCFLHYMRAEDATITRALFEQNLHKKRTDKLFTADIRGLLASPKDWDLEAGLERVGRELIEILPGDPWAGNPSAS